MITNNRLQNRLGWLIENEGRILADAYGRQWKFERCGFLFKGIGSSDVFTDGLKCEHLLMGDLDIKPLPDDTN